MIIGLTGSMGCGKGEAVKILTELGFGHITLSSLVKEEAKKRGAPEEREKLMEVGNSMRASGGPGILAKLALSKIEASGHDKWVIDGIRNPAEIDELRKGKNVRIIGIHANRDLLISRILERSRASDSKAREEIISKIERESGKGEPEEGQQVKKCMEKADEIMENEGTVEELRKKIISYYEKTQN